MTQITVSHQRNRWVEGGGSDQFSVGITFDTDISADCERELMVRIQRAQQFVEEAVLRRAVPPSEKLKGFMAKLPTWDTVEKLEAASAYASKLFADGVIDRREMNLMDEAIGDAIDLLAVEQVTLPGGDAMPEELVQQLCDKAVIDDLKKNLNLMSGADVVLSAKGEEKKWGA